MTFKIFDSKGAYSILLKHLGWEFATIDNDWKPFTIFAKSYISVEWKSLRTSTRLKLMRSILSGYIFQNSTIYKSEASEASYDSFQENIKTFTHEIRYLAKIFVKIWRYLRFLLFFKIGDTIPFLLVFIS